MNHPTRTMEIAARLCLGFALLASSLTSSPAQTGILITPEKGTLVQRWRPRPPLDSETIAVTFPTPMVGLDKIDKGKQPCPIVFDPPIDVHWNWVSPTEGELSPPIDFTRDGQGVLVRRIMYRAKLRAGLRDAGGEPVHPQNWGAEFADDHFMLSGAEFLNAPRPEDRAVAKADAESEPDDGEGEPPAATTPTSASADPAEADLEKRGADETLPARPRVRLEFSRDVEVAEVAKAVHFQDRESHERFPVEALLEGVQAGPTQGWVIVEPVAPLPPNRSFLLVVQRLTEPREKQALPFQKVLPAGKTYPMLVQHIAGYHQPVKGAFIRIRASKSFDADAASLSAITVEPKVAGLKVERAPHDRRSVELLGNFDTAATYKVTVPAGVKSVDQFALATPSTWTARFPKKRPAVILPQETLWQRASAPSVHCKFVQVNTGPLEWRIAAIPPEVFSQVHTRLREFGEFLRDAKSQFVSDAESGEFLVQPTVPLIPSLGLPVLATGAIPASGGDRDTAREVDWKPGNRDAGLFLLEITGKDAVGRTVGNRCIISRGDWVITRVVTATETMVRLARMEDAQPAPNVPVQLLLRSGEPTLAVQTDAAGAAHFDRAQFGLLQGGSPQAIFAGPPGRQCLQLLDTPDFAGGAEDPDAAQEPQLKGRGIIVTDRNLYRPGETVKMKGYLRLTQGEKISIPSGQTVGLRIADETDHAVSTGTVTTSANGSWQFEWAIPASALGHFSINANALGELAIDHGGTADVRVAEYRPLPYFVDVETAGAVGDTVTAQVKSAHFHGAPNAGARVRWKAQWLAHDWCDDELGEEEEEEDPKRNRKEEDAREPKPEPAETEDHSFRDRFASFVLDDQHSPDSPARGISGTVLSTMAKAGWDITHGTGLTPEVSTTALVEGETTLDANGLARVECKSPVRPGLYRRASVVWAIDVISASAQSLRGGAVAQVQFVPKILGVRFRQNAVKKLGLTVSSFDVADQDVPGLGARAELFHVTIKTVKEKVGSLSRYRNFPNFEKVWEGDLITPFDTEIPVTRTGNYVVRVRAPGQPNTPQVSAVEMVDGEEPASVEVETDTGLELKPDRPLYQPGDTAVLSLETPFTGIATVSVATDRVLAQQTIECKGNAVRIPLPVLPSFAPNAHVLVHLVKAAGRDGLPAERFGACEIAVSRPERELAVTTTLASETVEPRKDVAGSIKVLAGGKPLANADVLVFAVDDAVLMLGRWKVPDLLAKLSPYRDLRVTTHSSRLGDFVTPGEASGSDQSQKGFILGDGGFTESDFRKYFKALAYWEPNGRTNAAGELAFRFTAPDSLTRYRVVAVAQNSVAQFGTAQRLVRVAKQLQIEPALPDFVRVGDEITLRAVVRQSYADTDQIDVALDRLGSALQLTEPPTRRVTAARGQPVVVGFRAKVAPGTSTARVVFTASSAGPAKLTDSEDNTLRVRAPEIERRESIAGSLAAAQPLDLKAKVPDRWRESTGFCDVLLSGSPYLPKLSGLTPMLEAEGSLEKLSTRLLSATLLAETLAFMPLSADGEKNLRRTIEEGLRTVNRSRLSDGGLPCWPGSSDRSDFVTAQAAWALLNAEKRKIYVDPSLLGEARSDLEEMVAGKEDYAKTSRTLRCLALMVLAHAERPADPPAAVEEVASRDLSSEAEELFTARAEIGDEGRAWLALALHYLDILPEQRRTLLREIERPPNIAAFDPVTFSSKTRAEAIRLLAQSEINATRWSAAQRRAARAAFDRIAESSVDLSTQENLWLLMLFNSLTRGEVSPNLSKRPIAPKPTAASANGVSVGWLGVKFSGLAEAFPKPIQQGVKANWLLRATYPLAPGELPPRDPSLSLTRVVRNLTAPARNGSATAPFKLGDQVLTTYGLEANQPHSYVAVEDQLPACLETINPKLPLIAEHFKLPIEAGVNTLPLSNVEQRTERTVLYFEKTVPGKNTYSVLARVNVPGVCRWPATQVRTMYDSRFVGVAEGLVVHAVE